MNWDVKIGEPIEYFDPELSYELTGYRPITVDKGLDFRVDWFTEAKETKERTGKYCSFPMGSKRYADFWSQEYDRIRNGYTVNGYTLTGFNYFFLNYYQLPVADEDKIAGEGRDQDFPVFFAKQYEYFHYIALCRALKRDALGLKSRGVDKPARPRKIGGCLSEQIPS